MKATGRDRHLWNIAFVLALVFLTYYLLFQAPFHFPPRKQLVSASYVFGFNNGIAILALAVLLGCAALYFLGRCRDKAASPIIFAARPTFSLQIGFAVVVVCYVFLTFVMYVYDTHCAPAIMWETRHLLHRTLLMDVYGLHPYTEVAAEYGPILTYAPSYIYWALRPVHASHDQAYFASHLLLNVAGIWCVYYLLSRAVMPTLERLVALALVSLAGFAPYMGINGVLLRYLFPFASLLLGCRALRFMLSRSRPVIGWSGAMLVILSLLAGNILLSSEAGVAFTVAWCAYALLNWRADLRILAVSLLAFVVAAVACWVLLPAAYYGTLLRFSEGANNLPLLPSAHLLLYLLTLFLLVPPLLATGLRASRTAHFGDAALCFALGVLCVAMAPGALGRCDPPHVLLFGMGASLLLMIRLANVVRTAFFAYAVSYAAVFVIFIEAVNLTVFYGASPKILFTRHPLINVSQKFMAACSPNHLDLATQTMLDHYPRLGLPFASFGDPAVEKYVTYAGRLEPEYFVGVVGVYTVADIEHKLRDVGKAEYLLLPFDPTAAGPLPDVCSGYLKRLRQWFLIPVNLSCQAEALDPSRSLQSFISGHYNPVEHVGSWWIMRRAGPTPE